jgi:hypothetical protein
LKKFAILAIAITSMLAVTAVAVAQYALPVVNLTGSISPTKAGKKKKPRAAVLKAVFTVNKESNSTASRIVYSLPKNVKLDGKGFKFCTATQINNQGTASCPAKSKVGTGSATAVVGPRQSPLNFTVGIYAASRNSLALSLTGPLAIALPGAITKAGGKFGQKITVDIPTRVQQPVAGLYGNITGVTANIGCVPTSNSQGTVTGCTKKATTGKGKKKRGYVSVNGCPSDRTHDFGVQLTFVPNPNPPQQSTASDEAAGTCRK